MSEDQEPVPGMEPDLGKDDDRESGPDEPDPVSPRQDEETPEDQIGQRLGTPPNR
jgi:hypothetical protein